MSSAPVDERNVTQPRDADDEEMPRVVITRERALGFGLFVAVSIAFLYFVLPKISGGTSESIHNLGDGKPAWLVAALAFECLSFGAYVVLFRTVFVRGRTRIGWRASYEITMAGVAATRLFAAADAGGVALTAWALRRSGMEARIVACRIVAFLVLLYAVYMAAMVIFGLGLYFGVFNGPGPFAITVVPAVFALVLIALFLAMSLLPGDAERRITRFSGGSSRRARIMARAITIPASAATGVRTAIALVRDREWGTLGAVGWWAFDIAALWACFHAYGPDPPPFAVIVLAYFVGMLGNTLPLPGGIGGVDGGMIGAFAALGVSSDYAISAVLTYRAFAFWLPTLPGAIAYFQLRRRVATWREEHRAAKADAAVAQA
jgi:putative heme transporter